MLTQQIADIEAGMQRVAERLPGLPVPEAMLFRTLILLGRELTQVLEQRIRPHGLNETEFRVLMFLSSQPEGVGSPTQLCAGSAQSPANMTRLIDSLVERGLVDRAPSGADRRRTVLTITRAGTALVRELAPDFGQSLRALFGTLSATEIGLLRAQLGRIALTLDGLAVGALPAPAAVG